MLQLKCVGIVNNNAETSKIFFVNVTNTIMNIINYKHFANISYEKFIKMGMTLIVSIVYFIFLVAVSLADVFEIKQRSFA